MTTAEDASDYLFFTFEDCALAMTSSDANTDQMLFFGEFLDATIRLSPFPTCPDIESASNTDSSYRIVFEELQCACLDYPSLDPPTGSFDPLCCDRTGSASIRLPLQVYPEAYTERLCRGMELAMAADCSSTEPAMTIPPTPAPTNIPLSELFPTQPPTSERPSRSPVVSTNEKEDEESLLGLSTVWTIFAWIAFAACGLVLVGLVILLLASFCYPSGEKKRVTDSNDPNREAEHEIEFAAEEEELSHTDSNRMEQPSPACIDTSAEEQHHSVDNDDDGDEDYVDAAADEVDSVENDDDDDADDDGGDDDDDGEEVDEYPHRMQEV
ncbi:hypothetical protein FisN_7Hh154 [Fistulifera solaris]|jgi:hypothetical protein|uniref:Uncharacterized protein n=1 Tax=Fistulifera solaris TaxID=1519565 RepID=A0A1Z5K3P9_FISSO|nr:hypothetical protein FisN_7Hh154 [Fistulifera solaris]|eukprot:GAX20839.1 hypothetical protein FisN_7Hh154 [Fistulifera solaris]